MKRHSSGIISECFWFVEFKKLIKLRGNEISWDDIKLLCLNENIFCLSNPTRAKRMYGYLKNRIETLNKSIYKIFLEVDMHTQKIINFTGIMKSNRLFLSFYMMFIEKKLY